MFVLFEYFINKLAESSGRFSFAGIWDRQCIPESHGPTITNNGPGLEIIGTVRKIDVVPHIFQLMFLHRWSNDKQTF